MLKSTTSVNTWRRISLAGIEAGMEEHFRRKIELTNKISVTIGVLVFSWNLFFRFIIGADARMFWVLMMAVTGYFLIPVLNRARHYGLSRGLLTFLPPVAITVAAGLVSDVPITSFKFAMMSVIQVPVLIFGVEEPRKMLVGILWVAAAFPGMDALMPIIPTPAGLDVMRFETPLSFTLNVWLSCTMFTLGFIYFQRLNITAEEQLAREKAKSDRLLLNILPRDIAIKLKESQRTIAEHFECTSVLFADVVGFTPFSARITPDAVVDLLNELFSEFDRLAELFGVEKIKTIGDCYMAAAGVPNPSSEHAQALARLALAMQAHMERNVFQGQTLTLRIGINSGAVTAGVIGRNKFIYDLWGDTVNTASRMESQGRSGAIQITDATRALIKDEFICSPGGVIDVKGKGEMQVWHVLGVRDGRAQEAEVADSERDRS